MNTKEYLNQVSRLEKTIEHKVTEILQYRELATRLKSVQYGVKVRTSLEPDRIGNAIAKIDDMECQLSKLVNQYLYKKSYIAAQIDTMEDEKLYHVIVSRYIEKKTFEQIADELNYSQRQISRLHESALAEFEKKYGAEYLKTE